MGGIFCINTCRTAGKDDTAGIFGGNDFCRGIKRQYLAVNMALADAAGDQLSVLGAEI